jgi:transposase
METEKKQRKPRRRFTDEFKAGAVKLVLEEGKLPADVARDLDMHQSVLGRWVEQAQADGGKSTRGTLTTSEKEELARLRKENRTLRLERDILKKATAFFAKENA